MTAARDRRSRLSQVSPGGLRAPVSLDALITEEPRLLEKKDLLDVWGHPLRYAKKGAFTYELRSAGPDGIMGTEDDLSTGDVSVRSGG